jgi:hypothetical protein
MGYSGVSRDPIETQFWWHLADEVDAVDSIHRKIELLLHARTYACCHYQKNPKND